MKKVLLAVFVIFGAVVGSGFSSGKEIFVYFSRFGAFSFVGIFLATILFYFLFRYILLHGKTLSQRFKNSKIITGITGVVSVVFCASMMSGISNLFSYFSTSLQVILMCVVLVFCFFVTQKGMKSLERINIILMPIVSVLFFMVLVSFLFETNLQFQPLNGFGIFYAPLYVALNISMNVLVLSELGESMTKKEINLTCLLSVGLIFIFLILGNFALGASSSGLDMPFLTMAQNNYVSFFVMFFVILSGCFTTLISLCYTLFSALSQMIKNKVVCSLLAIFLPLAISALGFSKIVTILYPICSVAGLFVLAFLLLGGREKRK